jgi:anti-sigma factor RsiW
MNCDRSHPDIEAFADGELPLWRRWAIHRHLFACPACAARLAEVHALRERIRVEVPRFTAPPSLRAKVHALPDGRAAPASTRQGWNRQWQWVGVGALAGCALTVVSWLAANAMLSRATTDGIASAAVAAHVHATLAHQMTQVASTDQHTVKPWLSARLDYSPPVVDLAAEGFPLVGARIEQVDGLPVATLVYRYREHSIDVFVRPEWIHAGSRDGRTIRGFHVLHTEGQGMDWVAVSDTSTETLAPFLKRLAGGDSAR